MRPQAGQCTDAGSRPTKSMARVTGRTAAQDDDTEAGCEDEGEATNEGPSETYRQASPLD